MTVDGVLCDLIGETRGVDGRERVRERADGVFKGDDFDDVPPKEKHVQYLIATCGAGGSPKERVFVLEALAKQIRKCTPWRTMLKTHVVLHRLLRECREKTSRVSFSGF